MGPNDTNIGEAGRLAPCFSAFLELGAVTNLVGNYAAAAQLAKMTVPVGSVWHVERLTLTAAGAGTLRSDNYCVISLNNGVRIQIQRGIPGTSYVWTNGRDMVCNNCLDAHGAGSMAVRDWGAGDKEISVDLLKDTSGIVLNGDTGEALWVRLNDDFSGLSLHTWKASGRILRGPDLFA